MHVTMAHFFQIPMRDVERVEVLKAFRSLQQLEKGSESVE